MARPKGPETPRFDPDALISLEDAGRLIGVSPERIRVLIKDGFIERPKPGRVVLSSVVRGYSRYWQDKASQSTKTAADSRLRDVRALEIERRIAIKDRDLVPKEEAQAAIDHIVAAHLEVWTGLPAMITRDVRERARIEVIVKKAQGQVAKRLAEAARILRDGGDLPDASL